MGVTTRSRDRIVGIVHDAIVAAFIQKDMALVRRDVTRSFNLELHEEPLIALIHDVEQKVHSSLEDMEIDE